MILRILFLVLNNINFQFGADKLTWKSYIITEALPTTCQVELIDKREIAKTALNKNSKTFIVHIATLEVLVEIPVHPLQVVQIPILQWDKVSTKILTKYSNFANIFSTDL